MLYVIQGGRCGNQLFVYAFARKLQLDYPNEKITFDFSGLKVGQEKYINGAFWEDSLSRFNVTEYESIYNDKLVFEYGEFVQKCAFIVWKLLNKLIKDNTSEKANVIRQKLFEHLSRFGIYYIQMGYAPYKLTKYKNKFVFGAFEDVRWFDEIREILLNEFTPKKPILEHNTELYKTIQDKNSVCVSLRKWSLDVHDDNELKNRDLCGPEYYKQAISYIMNKVEKPVFIVFSDDVEWAKAIVKSISGNAMVLSERGDDDVAEKIRLMSACKHFIISNSTFGWWPQYMGQDPNKIVISPDRWNDSFEEQHSLIQKDWILIPTKK